jgi:hypothetical protein
MAKKSDRPRDMANDIIGAIRDGTKKWTRTRKTEERSPASRRFRHSRMTRERRVSLKDAAAQILPEAYAKVSGDGQLPANARQLMYAARGYIQKETGQELNANYFTQTLLPDYLNDTGVAWDVAYDARGHFNEPHDGYGFGIGTLEVRSYLKRLRDPSLVEAGLSEAKVKTFGPKGNFGAVLFIEKEGFSELIKAARIADRFDIGLMSTKGMSVTAARALADQMCHDYDLPLLLVHDFDKSGFSIAGTLQRDTRRYEFQNSIKTIDLGLSLDDVTAMNLESEYQYHEKGDKVAMMTNLRTNGASEEEIAFMFHDFDRLRSTRRVELNAMTSPQFVAFLEQKLIANGVRKVVPDADMLTATYRSSVRSAKVEQIVDDAIKEVAGNDISVPENLADQVTDLLRKNPAWRWDDAVQAIAEDEDDTSTGGEP